MRHGQGLNTSTKAQAKRNKKTTEGLVRPTNASSSTFREHHPLYPDRPVPASKERWEFLGLECFSGSLFSRIVQIEQSHKVMAQVLMHSGHTHSERMENQAALRRRWCSSDRSEQRRLGRHHPALKLEDFAWLWIGAFVFQLCVKEVRNMLRRLTWSWSWPWMWPFSSDLSLFRRVALQRPEVLFHTPRALKMNGGKLRLTTQRQHCRRYYW